MDDSLLRSIEQVWIIHAVFSTNSKYKGFVFNRMKLGTSCHNFQLCNKNSTRKLMKFI